MKNDHTTAVLCVVLSLQVGAVIFCVIEIVVNWVLP